MAASLAAPENRETESEAFGPWNPGINSQLTPELWRLCTIFRQENVFTAYDLAVELNDATGIALPELVVFRPDRMVLHEVLIRVIADYEISDPEGADVRSMGINFRRMTHAILHNHLAPHMAEIVKGYAPARDAIANIVRDELAQAFGSDRPSANQDAPPQSRGLLSWLRRRPPNPPSPIEEEPWQREQKLIDSWRVKSEGGAVSAAAHRSLVRVVSAVRGLNGRLWGSPAFLEPLVQGLACNEVGRQLIADRVGPMIAEAARAERFRALPPQQRPIAMTTKGAAASGKSTMRSLQRSLATRMGASWSDFALISPDIFRRDLLDIESLGPHYKYFGTFTSHELEVIDRKLDDYLARKAELHATPHLLVDRFRFDSFAPNSEEQRKLLARLGGRRLIAYFFMITPPEKTVERAWKRGLQLGRYKPVDDLLAHNVEAYKGMPSFFFARALHSPDLNQHYEFLDNDVALGETPLTVAFGSNREFVILNIKRLVDMDRYAKINVNARGPEQVYPDAESLKVENNLNFLATCIRGFPVLNLALHETGRVYARLESGHLVWNDSAALATINDPETLTALRQLVPDLFARLTAVEPERHLDPEAYPTLGRWGKRTS